MSSAATRFGRPMIIAGLLAALLVGVAFGWAMWGRASRHGHEAAVASSGGGVAPGTGVAPAGQNQEYTCSMHPQVRSPNPKDKCPICGMDLILVPTDGTSDDDGDLPVLRLTPRAVALMQIQVQPVERRVVEIPIRVFGRLSYDETRLRTIAAWVPGRLEKLYVDFTGVAVQAGDPMVEIYSPPLIAAQEELLQSVKAVKELEKSGEGVVLQSTRATVDASRERLRLLGLSREQIAEIESRGRGSDHLRLLAPVSGVVIERLASAGDFVETGQAVYRLADLTTLWAQLEVYEADLHGLAVGQTATFTTQSGPGEPFTGAVTFIDPMVSDPTRTVRVRVDVPNPQGKLKPGMFIRGQISAVVSPATRMAQHNAHGEPAGSAGASPQAENQHLVIPATAPLLTGQRAVVYVQTPNADRPTFEPRDILLGAKAGPWYVVREGLKEGELVVSHGAFKLDSELQIRGRPSMMQPDGGRPPAHHDHAGTTTAPAAATPATAHAPRAFQTELGKLVRANFTLAEALASDDHHAAGMAAQKAMDVLHAVKAGLLTDAAAKQAWQGQSEAMHQALASVKQAGDLKAQRTHFESFSNALTLAVKSLGIAETGPVYRAMCPMVQGRRGYWLQANKTVNNPYFGASMLRCGEIVETILEDGAQGEGHR